MKSPRPQPDEEKSALDTYFWTSPARDRRTNSQLRQGWYFPSKQDAIDDAVRKATGRDPDRDRHLVPWLWSQLEKQGWKIVNGERT